MGRRAELGEMRRGGVGWGRAGIAGAGWGGTRRVGAGVGWVTRRDAVAQGGAGRHRAEAGRRREGEEVRWGDCDALPLCRSASLAAFKKICNRCFGFLL